MNMFIITYYLIWILQQALQEEAALDAKLKSMENLDEDTFEGKMLN